MEMGIIRGLITLSILVLFLSIWAWSWSRRRTTDFEATSRLPLEDDRHVPYAENNKEQTS